MSENNKESTKLKRKISKKTQSKPLVKKVIKTKKIKMVGVYKPLNPADKPKKNLITRVVIRSKKSHPLSSDALSYLNFLRKSQRITFGTRQSQRSTKKQIIKIKPKGVHSKKRGVLPSPETPKLVKKLEEKFKEPMKVAMKVEKAIHSEVELPRTKGGSEPSVRSKIIKITKETEKKIQLHPAARMVCGAVASKMDTTCPKTTIKKVEKRKTVPVKNIKKIIKKSVVKQKSS